MSKKNDTRHYPKGTGLAFGILFGVLFALATSNNALFVIGIALGAGLETTFAK